jgi:hypothetical protein
LETGRCPVESLAERLGPLVAKHAPAAIAVGRGTNAKAVSATLEGLGVPLLWVDEYETTRRARELYFEEHPPRGWRRLVPRGMLLPDRPVDDYAAILIGRRHLENLAAPSARGDA